MFELTAIVVFLGAIIQGLSGFGFGLVTMPLLGLYLPIRVAVPLVAIHGFVLVALMSWRLRIAADRSKWLPLVAGGVLATPMGVYYLRIANEHLLKTCLGVFVLIYSIMSLTARLPSWKLSNRYGYLAGCLGGILGGAFNTGGPPVIVYVTTQGWKKDEIRSALQIFFLALGLWKLPLYWGMGLFTSLVIKITVITLPATVVGTLFGDYLSHRFGETRFRKILLILLVILGITLIVR